MKRPTVIASILGMVLFGGSVAHAATEAEESAKVTVSIADLNLSTALGAKAMLMRLKQASQQICGPAPRPMDMQAMDSYRACFKTTLTSAVNQLNAPLVSVAFAQAEGKPSALAMAKLPD